MRHVIRLASIALATALLAAGGLALPASPASAAAKKHTLTFPGGATMKIKDQESGQDENGSWLMLGNFDILGDDVHWWNCAGGEVRGVFDFSSKPVSGKPGYAAITIEVNLYEGSSCSPGDWENGEITVFTMEPNTTSTQNIHVRTREMCGPPWDRERCTDYVDLKFKISNIYE